MSPKTGSFSLRGEEGRNTVNYSKRQRGHLSSEHRGSVEGNGAMHLPDRNKELMKKLEEEKIEEESKTYHSQHIGFSIRHC